MTERLTKRQIELVSNLCVRSNAEHAKIRENALKGRWSYDQIEILCGLISDEMMLKGIAESFEPNEYGIELEALIDAINRPRLLQ
jgi:hypothetical protein